MTPLILIDKLIEFIKPVMAEFELQSNVPGVLKAPQVIPGYLGEKKPIKEQDPPDFPYVIIRYLEDEDVNTGATAKVRIYAGTYSEDTQDGWRDAVNVITKIKTALKRRSYFGPFKVEYPIKTELPEEQPYPEWVAVLNLTVTIPQVYEEGGYQVGI
ncbi:hypothetical protein Dred_1210 [Desulforamulus reducens MI-1]|uniref:Uncharacterized protein n=1 Tax=Desulforamulus reducens (strain ATCC BAA-1160 / DSM 100696 / MI-1) TaxID=349161 RepID=A4J3U1_DESRM|nr:hypothetical protein [Desulforamulus reducens]ABO49744.1 hypothetical protein Dred_1210 [Desulforamulus reducens MI-1]